ncbi:MAG: hypothetical protein ACFFDT_30890 [Candidatus Hodarchaeota archaeon]
MTIQKYQSWENPRCLIFKEIDRTHKMSADVCLICKGGRLLCGRPRCPILQQLQKKVQLTQKPKKEIFGKVPSIFVGWKNYPYVFNGPMITDVTSEEELDLVLTNPSKWYGLTLEKIAELRFALIRGMTRIDARIGKKIQISRLVQDLQDIAASTRAVEAELTLKRSPKIQISYSAIAQPMGPAAPMKKFEMTENPKIPTRVDRLSESNVSAATAIGELYLGGADVYYLQNIFSAGILGRKRVRRIVPTRWSITSIDDILAKQIIDKIRDYPEIKDYLVFSNSYVGNNLVVLMIPREKWSYEQFEAWTGEGIWTRDITHPIIIQCSEGYQGRTKYAFEEGGGYYAIRFPIVEYLNKLKRQATIIVFREITSDYYIPVGVWQCRESVKRALKSSITFDTLEDALKEIKNHLNIPLKLWLRESKIYKKLKGQRRLLDFI